MSASILDAIRVYYVALQQTAIPSSGRGSKGRVSTDGKVKRENGWMADEAAFVTEPARGWMTSLTAYLGLFLVAFGAATVLPFQSEPLFVGMLVSGKFSTLWLLVVASIGNVLGAVLNGVLGRFIDRFHDRSWFPVKTSSLEKAARWYRRYGRWSLLLSWMPVFGDALTVLAGVLREPWWSFLLLVTVGKTARYIVLAAATFGTQAAIG